MRRASYFQRLGRAGVAMRPIAPPRGIFSRVERVAPSPRPSPSLPRAIAQKLPPPHSSRARPQPSAAFPQPSPAPVAAIPRPPGRKQAAPPRAKQIALLQPEAPPQRHLPSAAQPAKQEPSIHIGSIEVHIERP